MCVVAIGREKENKYKERKIMGRLSVFHSGFPFQDSFRASWYYDLFQALTEEGNRCRKLNNYSSRTLC